MSDPGPQQVVQDSSTVRGAFHTRKCRHSRRALSKGSQYADGQLSRYLRDVTYLHLFRPRLQQAIQRSTMRVLQHAIQQSTVQSIERSTSLHACAIM